MKQEMSRLTMFKTCAATAALLLATGVSANDGTLPPIKHVGSITYLSGGVGDDETSAMKAAAPKYALSMTFSSRIDNRSAYASPSRVNIVNGSGASVLDVKPDGPFLLINLPAGKYRVTAGSGDNNKTQPVEIVAGGHKTLDFDLADTHQVSQR